MADSPADGQPRPAASWHLIRSGLAGWRLGLPVLLIGMALTVVLWLNARDKAEAAMQDRFEYRTERIQAELAHRFDGYSDALHSVAGLLGGSPGLERQRWRNYFERISSPESYPGRRVLAFAPRVSDHELAAHVERSRREGLAGYTVLNPARGDTHYPLAYARVFQPVAGLALGTDLAADPQVPDAVERSLVLGQAVLTGPLAASPSLDEADQVWALITPAYTGDLTPTTEAERRSRITGVVLETFNPMATGKSTLGPDAHLIGLQISIDGQRLLTCTELQQQLGAGLQPRLSRVSQIDYGERTLTLEFYALSPYMAAAGESQPTGVLASGLVISLLLAAMVGSLAGRRRQALALVEERTTALREALARAEQALDHLRSSEQEVQERRRIETELVAAREQALAAAKAKADFLANMSHEIRTPMHAVIGMTALLDETQLTPEQRGYVETIRVSGDALLATINDILDFSKIESGMLELEQAPFELGALIEEAFDMLAPRAAEKGIDLLYGLAEDVPRWVTGDAARLRQIFVNLLSNAVKFTARGEVCLSAAVVSADAEQVRLQFAVRDTGIGIAPEQRVHLFKAFSQADSSTTRQYGGSGLGLAICQRLTHLMRGEIGVESTPGQGSTFTFTILVRPAQAGAPRRYIDHEVAELRGLRVLLVDDHPTNLQLLHTQCARWGLQVRSCDNGPAALALLDQPPTVDAVILDMQMPGMDGVQLARAIRQRRGAQAPVLLLLSSGPTARFARSAADLPEAGLFDAQLAKPVKHSLLLQTLVHLLAPGSVAQRHVSHAPRLDRSLAERLPMRILVVEDSLINQKLAVGILAKLGYSSDVAGNGVEALERLQQSRYDLVFMDLQMPQMDGLEATRRLLDAGPTMGRPRVIATTANALPGDRERCLAAGMDDYLAKPMLPVDVQAVIERWAPQRQRTRHDAAVDAPLIDQSLLDELRSLDEPGRPSLLEGLLRDFIAETPAALSDIKRFCTDHEVDALARRAHKLAGVSASLGASGVAETCRHLEQHASAGDLAELPALIDQLELRFARTRALLLQPA